MRASGQSSTSPFILPTDGILLIDELARGLGGAEISKFLPSPNNPRFFEYSPLLISKFCLFVLLQQSPEWWEDVILQRLLQEHGTAEHWILSHGRPTGQSIHPHTNVCIWLCVCVCMGTCIYGYVCMVMFVYGYVCLHVCLYVCIFIYWPVFSLIFTLNHIKRMNLLIGVVNLKSMVH